MSKIYPGVIILVECKASPADIDKAVQEAAWYSKGFFGEYDIIVVGAAGVTPEEFRVKTCICTRDKKVISEGLSNYEGFRGNDLLSFDEYERWITYSAEKRTFGAIEDIKCKIAKVMKAAGNINSDKRMLIVSACLLALNDPAFADTFERYPDERILEQMLASIRSTLTCYKIPKEKVDTMLINFNTLYYMTVLRNEIKIDDGYTNPLRYLLKAIHYSELHNEFEGIKAKRKTLDVLNIDIMGEFYSGFISSGQDLGDSKNGFVLTPRHICELFADLGQLDEKSKVLDMCFGTGGFLVAAMQKEIKASKGDKEIIKDIKANNFCGVELDGDRFTYGCVNMILRGDGQSNMIQGDCFDKDIVKTMKDKHCTVGFMNPPYSLPTNEMRFVENLLDCLEPGGRGIVIVPLSCAGNKSNDYRETRRRILEKHTLEAVMSMPSNLFYPVNVKTCIMVFTAGKPHDAYKKTWIANCSDDGLVTTKGQRTDANNVWVDKKKAWVSAFLNRDEISGFSIKRVLTADDEWSWESQSAGGSEIPSEKCFRETVFDYAFFMFRQGFVNGR